METAESRIELIEVLLRTMIANIGYPVGCGQEPHPKTVRQMAEHCFKIATHQDA